MKWFRRYVRRYLRKHFHRVSMLRGGPPECTDGQPLVVLTNHAGWWDPMVGLFLAERFFPVRRSFAPIDARALERYRILRKMGFFGIEPDRPRGAKQFLDHALGILEQDDTALWLTPQGEFADPRDRPVRFKPGLGHLAAKLGHGQALPVAIEYPFWEERTPELLIAFGEPVALDSHAGAEPAAWTKRLETALEATQDRLAAAARDRDPRAFEELLGGSAGVGGIYDRWRRLRGALGGKSFDPRHGSLNEQSPPH